MRWATSAIGEPGVRLRPHDATVFIAGDSEGERVKLTNAGRLDEGMMAISSLSRAMGPSVQLSDVGPLLWVLLRQIAPCDGMALFLPDHTGRHVVIRYAAGPHASALAGLTRPVATGIAGWVAVHGRTILNSEPMLDLGFRANLTPALRSSLVVPVIHGDTVIAVLALYSTALLAFTEDQLDKLDLLSGGLGIALRHAVVADEHRPPAKTSVISMVRSS
jgi:GAF domain-containing protein